MVEMVVATHREFGWQMPMQYEVGVAIDDVDPVRRVIHVHARIDEVKHTRDVVVSTAAASEVGSIAMELASAWCARYRTTGVSCPTLSRDDLERRVADRMKTTRFEIRR